MYSNRSDFPKIQDLSAFGLLKRCMSVDACRCLIDRDLERRLIDRSNVSNRLFNPLGWNSPAKLVIGCPDGRRFLDRLDRRFANLEMANEFHQSNIYFRFFCWRDGILESTRQIKFRRRGKVSPSSLVALLTEKFPRLSLWESHMIWKKRKLKNFCWSSFSIYLRIWIFPILVDYRETLY